MPPDERTNIVLAWLRKAENDLTNIALVLPNPDCPFDTVCFHAQQAAEKYLKGLLVHLNVAFPKTHDIAEILDLAPRDIRLNLTPGEIDALTQWAVFSRYPSLEEDIQRSEAEAALEAAQHIKEAVLSALRREGFAMSLLNRPRESKEES
jgi:HEPN domain-containing protein